MYRFRGLARQREFQFHIAARRRLHRHGDLQLARRFDFAKPQHRLPRIRPVHDPALLVQMDGVKVRRTVGGAAGDAEFRASGAGGEKKEEESGHRPAL